MSEPKDDYQLDEKIKIEFEGMPYWIMPRYKHHYIENSYERFSLRLLRNLLNENDTLLDIGAHYGAYSLFAAKHCKSKVIALEPVSENYQLLIENINENQLQPHVTAYNVAASDKDGEAEFNIPWASDSAGFYEHPLAETIKKQKVIVKNVDHLVKNQRIDLIKIDTEGHELHVLDGLQQTLKRNPDTKLLVEANPDCLNNAGASVVELLAKLSNEFDKEIYVVSETDFTLYRITENIEDWVTYIGEHGYANILCVPKKNHRFGLFVCHSSDVGGAELALSEVVDKLRQYNFFSHVVIPDGGALEQVLINKGISYSILPYHFWSESLDGRNKLDMEAAENISTLARKLHVEVVANNTMACPWGLPAARELGLPLVWFVHEFGDLDHHIPFRYPIEDIRRYIIQQSDLVVCCSNAVRDVLLITEPNKHTHTVYNLLDIKRVQRLAEEPVEPIFSANADLKVCITGRISESKGQAVALRAIASLKKQGVRAELAMIGVANESYAREIKSLIKSLGLGGQVKLLGHQKNPFGFVKQADVSVTCASYEAFGRNTAEAMALGVPVIGTASGGTLELIQDNQTGLLFNPGDADALADALLKIRKNPQLARLFAEKAQVRISRLLNYEKNLSKLNRLLQEVDYSQQRTYGRIFFTEALDAIRREVADKQSVDHYLEKSEERNHDLEVTNLELLSTVKNLQDERDALLQSSSWRLTQPLRKSKRLVGRVKRKVNRILDGTKTPPPVSSIEDVKAQYTFISGQFRNIQRSSSTKAAVILHLFYPDMWQTEFASKLSLLKRYNFDLYVTVPIGASVTITDTIHKDFPGAYIFEVPNRGRDVLPFLQVARQLKQAGYEYVLKLHSKKSPQRIDGQDWLRDMLHKLLPKNKEAIEAILKKLKQTSTGIIGPSGHYLALPVSTISQSVNRQNVYHVMSHAFSAEKAHYIDHRWWDYGFFEGTMFWVRLSAIEPLLDIPIHSFEEEAGQTDGTLAHAVERALCLCPEVSGMKIFEVDTKNIRQIAYKTDVVPEWSDLFKGERRRVTK